MAEAGAEARAGSGLVLQALDNDVGCNLDLSRTRFAAVESSAGGRV